MTVEIIGRLREAEVIFSQGGTKEAAAKATDVTVQTFFRWRKEYSGLRLVVRHEFYSSIYHGFLKIAALVIAFRRL